MCVVGTDICADVDDSGNFELSGDFSGDISLHFIGLDQDLTLTIHDVKPGETVTVTVELDGASSTIRIESREAGDDSPDDPSDDPSEDDVSEDEEVSEDDVSEDDVSEDDVSEDDVSEDDVSEDDNTSKGNKSKGGKSDDD